MSNLKTLLIILVVIFLVGAVGAEVYYLFFYQPKPSSPQTISITPTPVVKVTPTLKVINVNLNILKNSALISSRSINQYEGSIVEIDTDGGIAEKFNNFKYEVALVIKGRGSKPNSFYFNKDMLTNIKVVQAVNGAETSIPDIRQLKVGDRINIEVTWDFDADTGGYNRLVEGKIKRI